MPFFTTITSSSSSSPSSSSRFSSVKSLWTTRSPSYPYSQLQYHQHPTYGQGQGYQPIDINIIITPATPALTSTPGFGYISGKSSGSSGDGTSSALNNPPRASFSVTASGGVQRCARVLSYDTPSQRDQEDDDEDRDEDDDLDLDLEEMDIHGTERVGLRSRPVPSGSSYPGSGSGSGWTYTNNNNNNHTPLLLSPTTAQSPSNSSRSRFGTCGVGLSGKNKLHLVVFFLALCLASLGVVGLMIPDLVGGLGLSKSNGPTTLNGGRYTGMRYPHAQPEDVINGAHVEFVDLSFGEETLHGLPSSSESGGGRVVEGLKARAFFPRPGSRLRMDKRRVEGGRWGFSMGWVGRPVDPGAVGGEVDQAGFDENAMDHLRGDHIGVDVDSESKEVVAPGTTRPGPKVQVVQPEQVQRMLLQQSRDRLRRRRQVLQDRV